MFPVGRPKIIQKHRGFGQGAPFLLSHSLTIKNIQVCKLDLQTFININLSK